MLTPNDIRNTKRTSGYNYVSLNRGSETHPKPWVATLESDAGGATKRGPRRATPEEAAQDRCDYINGNPLATPAAPLKSAGHNGKRAPLARDPEVEAALGMLRDARAQRRGRQGYVYLIIEVLPGGGLRYGKVGFSTNPQARVAELQTGNPRALRLHLSKPGTEADEAALHQKYIHNNVLQEWFHITKELLLEWDASHQVPVAQSDGQSQKEAA